MSYKSCGNFILVEMLFTKSVMKHGKKVKVGITIERLSNNTYSINDFMYSRNGRDYIKCTDDLLKNNELVYVTYRNWKKDNKLLYKGKRVDTCEIGTLTVYVVADNIVIPCSLIDEALDLL